MRLAKPSTTKQKPHMRQLSNPERKRFYLQEIFGVYSHLKKYLSAVLVFVLVGEIIKNVAASMQPDPLLHDKEIWIVNIPLLIGCVTYSTLFLKKFEHKFLNSITVRYAILFVANISLGLSFGFHTYYYFKKVALYHMDQNLIYNGAGLFASGIYWFMVVDIMTPIWTLKIIVPISYFIGLLLGLYELMVDDLTLGWIQFVVGTLNIIFLCCVKTYFRWQLYINKTDNEALNEVHNLILNKVPSPIVVFNENGVTQYSNPEFNNLAGGNTDAFLKRIVHLQRRRNFKENEEGSLHQDSIKPDRSLSSDNLRWLQNNSSNNPVNSGGMRRATTTGPYAVIDQEEDLMKLLGKVRKMFKEGRMDDEIYLVFDGKLKGGLHKDSSFEVTLSFINEYQKIIMILKDTTEHARIVALETNNQYKDKLLASVSHELRTPLNSNLFLIEETLHREDVSSTLKEQYLLPAYRSGRLLFHIINDILDYSQIAAKKLRLNFEDLSIRETMNNCYQLLELQVSKKGLAFNTCMDPEIPTAFMTDHDRVKQIILNLLSNALKFTFKGKIELRAQMLDAAQLKITVEDTGIGIKTDELKKLFHEFTRINNPDQANINAQGVGLGLTIANKIAKCLGPKGKSGGIKVESIQGQGSKFSFIILDKSKEKSGSKTCHDETEGRTAGLAKAKDYSFQFIREMSGESLERFEEGVTIEHTSRYLFHLHNNNNNRTVTTELTSRKPAGSNELLGLELLTSPSKTSRRKKPRILIVDDDPFNILAVESFLKKANTEIDCAYNGKEAVEKVQQAFSSLGPANGYDLILMDCQMPIMDGYKATQTLTDLMKKGVVPDVPIIGCTAFDGTQRVQLCYESGMKEVINKPLSKAKMEKILKNFL